MSDISPMSRDEKLLRKLLGQSIETEEPQSRIEVLLKQLIDEGGVGGIEIKGSYDTVEELEAAHPTGSAGDAYLVGSPSHIYTWLTDSEEWHDGGAFSAVAGEDGVGIASIAKTGTSGLVDTYTITLTDGNTYDYTVTNGEPGEGVPEGGTTGQILVKKSNSDYDTEWQDNSGGSDYSSEIASLASINSTQTSEIGSLASEIDSMSVSDVSSELESLSTENSTQSSELASLASEIESMSVSDYNSQLASLSTENSTQASELASLSTASSELASAQAAQSESQSVIDSTQNSEIASLSSNESAVGSQIASLASQNSTQTSEIGSLSTAESEMNSEIEVLQSQVAEGSNGYPLVP